MSSVGFLVPGTCFVSFPGPLAIEAENLSSTRLGTEYSRVHEYHLSITPGTHLGTKYSANSRIILRLYRLVFHISSQYAVKKREFYHKRDNNKLKYCPDKDILSFVTNQ